LLYPASKKDLFVGCGALMKPQVILRRLEVLLRNLSDPMCGAMKREPFTCQDNTCAASYCDSSGSNRPLTGKWSWRCVLVWTRSAGVCTEGRLTGQRTAQTSQEF
jgi:hypothetical protein